MRAAPPVEVCCTGGSGWRSFRCLLSALSAAALAGWTALRMEWLHAAWFATVAALLAGWIVFRHTPPTPCGLRWDGTAWSADGVGGSLDVMMDLGFWMLLRFRPLNAAGRRARWVAVSQSEAATAWHGLRVAVHARAAATPAGIFVAERAVD